MSDQASQFPSSFSPTAATASGRRPPGCRANQVAARRADLAHAAAACGAERPQPAGDCRHDHIRRAVSRPSRPGRARRRVARLPVCDADPTHGSERHGRRRLVRNCTRARRRQARCRRRAYASHFCSGPWPCGGILDSAAARRTIRLSMDGRAWRNTIVRACLLERGVQRRRIHLHAQSARQRRARNRQYGPARRRHRRQRDRARSHLAIADFRMGTVAGPWSGRCRLGPDDVVRRRQPRAARLSALAPLARHFGVSRRVPAVGTFRRNPQGRRAGIDQCDHHQSLGRAADRASPAIWGERWPSATRWARASNTSSSRWRSVSARRSSRWSAPTGAPSSIAGPARSRGPEARPWRLRAQRSD